MLVEDRIKNETEELLLNYNYGNNNYYHGKQQNQWTK